jgi:hypothetical protein
MVTASGLKGSRGFGIVGAASAVNHAHVCGIFKGAANSRQSRVPGPRRASVRPAPTRLSGCRTRSRGRCGSCRASAHGRIRAPDRHSISMRYVVCMTISDHHRHVSLRTSVSPQVLSGPETRPDGRAISVGVTIRAPGGVDPWPYRTLGDTSTPVSRVDEREVTMLPYFAWANRGHGAMKVWIPIAGWGRRRVPAHRDVTRPLTP